MRKTRQILLLVVTSALAACSQTQDVTAPPASATLRMSNGQAGKTNVCHRNDEGGAQNISVSENALATHMGHGDYLPGQFVIPAGSTVSASNTWVDRGPASNAFDGNTTTEWNAGAHPVQWIEIDFGSPRTIAGISALIDLVPDSFTNHDVTLDGVAAFSWTGNTVNGETLTHTFATPQTVQTVRITTTQSDSWVAWVEISFQGVPGSC